MASVAGSSMSMTSFSSLKQNQASARISSLSYVSLSINGRSFPALAYANQLVALGFPARDNHVAGNNNTALFEQAKPETVTKVCEIVRKQLALPADTTVSGDSKFATLGADSLDMVEIVMGLEEEFGINVEEESAQSIATVQDAADLIEKLIVTKSA